MAPHELIPVNPDTIVESQYFPYPHSVNTLPQVYRIGLVPIVVFSLMSLVSVTIMLGCITRRLISWRTHHREFVGYNQFVILIYQLLLADLQQSIAFAISIHWLSIDKILAPTAPCFIQAWFLHIGDVASGFFVLAIAIHTWLGVVKQYKMPYSWFVANIVMIWIAALILTIAGPIMHGDHFFSLAGGWCWVSSDYQKDRLYLHYLWIFIVEFGTVAIYGHVFIHLRGRISFITNNDTTKLTRATKFMVLYPAVYVILTAPLAIARMLAMGGVESPDVFFCVAGSLLTSCGWMDALLYTLTRRILNDDTASAQYAHTLSAVGTNVAHSRDTHDFGLQSTNSKEPVTAIARTVTIVGGSSSRLSRIVDHRRGRPSTHSAYLEKDLSREPSPTGSQDILTKSMTMDGATIVAETNIHVETESIDGVTLRSRDRSGSSV
ncbi:hypothetical protein P153DRAFT_374017 [Dothidotthia symphoricarpi CBS 119687]|uniref:Uncharacterized protein n=1 Tax=Dothidotthia symphoricarpi CBS 119687 TaxID=1392245 RepID=A0A6A6AM40_9PLEO|nr:uncharacterized protein P153DRAFT_374017 [Dothidotthia symphoricarpi CBS 119687]KAF2132233.1 hypothetical protein P153DRAFT_374017 [Dothidotthia symphoricarpi CBS 119687]